MYNEASLFWELAPIGVAKVDRSGKFLEINPRFCEMLGYSETELLSRTYKQVTHPDDLDADVSEAENLLDHPEHGSYQMVKRYISKDGRTVWVSLYVHAIRDSSERFSMFYVFAIELLHVGIYPGGQPSSPVKILPGKRSLWEYVRENPKEAMVVFVAIAGLLQGKNVFEIIQEFILKK